MDFHIWAALQTEVLKCVTIVLGEANTYAWSILPQLYVMGTDGRDVARAAGHPATPAGYQMSEGQGHKSWLPHTSWRLCSRCYRYLFGENKSS